MTSQPRLVTPRRLAGLLLAGTAAGMSAGAPAAAHPASMPAGRHAQAASMVLAAAAEEGEGGEGAVVKRSAESGEAGERGEAGEGGEGGEGGEAGAVADADPAVAGLARLHIVEGHLAAAAELYALGLADEAVALSYHPEAEMMEEVRESLSGWGATDVTPAMTAFSEAMAGGAESEAVAASLTSAQAAFEAAAAKSTATPRERADALLVLIRAAASEYGEVAESGTVEDLYGYHEAHGFLEVARRLAQAAAQTGNEADAKAYDRIGPLLDEAAPAFAHIDATEDGFAAGDPSILFGIAARAEIALLKIR